MIKIRLEIDYARIHQVKMKILASIMLKRAHMGYCALTLMQDETPYSYEDYKKSFYPAYIATGFRCYFCLCKDKTGVNVKIDRLRNNFRSLILNKFDRDEKSKI